MNWFDQELREKKSRDESKEDTVPASPVTGIAWNQEKYHGTPLQLGDERLGNLAKWVQLHNLTVVKVDKIPLVAYASVGPYHCQLILLTN